MNGQNGKWAKNTVATKNRMFQLWLMIIYLSAKNFSHNKDNQNKQTNQYGSQR